VNRMSTAIMPTARGHSIAAVGAVLALTVSGCGSGSDRPGAETSAASQSATDLGSVRVRYRYEERIDGEKSRIEWEVITGPSHRSRYTIIGGFNADGPSIGTYYVYDGKVLMSYEPDGEQKYSLNQHPTKTDIPPGPLVAAPGSPLFARYCPKAERRGEQTVLGRDAVSYACTPTAAQKEGAAPDNLVVDSATGLLLEAGPLVVTQLQFNPPTTAATFSTEIPDDTGYAPLHFAVSRLGGGYLSPEAYLGRPLLVITGGAAGIRSLAHRLAPLTKNGQSPRVIALLIATPPVNSDGSPIDFDDATLAASISRQVGDLGVPTGMDLQGAAGAPISGPAGMRPGETRPAAVGFVRSDGILAAVLTERATTDQLAQEIAGLH